MQGFSSGLIRQHQSKLAFIYRLSDCVLIIGVLYFSLRFNQQNFDNQYALPAGIAVAAFSLIADNIGVYRSYRGVSLIHIITPILNTWLATLLLIILWVYVVDGMLDNYFKLAIFTWLIITPFVLLLWRYIIVSTLAFFRRRGFNTRSVAIVCANSLGNRLATIIKNTPSFGFRLKGFYEDRVNNEENRLEGDLVAPIIGDLDDLVQHARRNEVDIIYVTMSLKGQDRIAELVKKLSDTTVNVYLAPDFFVFDLLHSTWSDLGPIPIVSIHDTPFRGVNSWLKRLEDIVLSSFILCVIFIPMLIIAVAIKLSSPGPVLFKQRRYGMDGKVIKVWKFRTMTVCEDGDCIKQVKEKDLRITPLGGILRRTSLDELPQFFNVLTGKMSIVGPRPHAVAHNEEYRKRLSGYMLRHKVKPGITGLAQVKGWRGETDTLEKMEKRLEYDLSYIRNWSLLLDLTIILRTIITGFFNKNAY